MTENQTRTGCELYLIVPPDPDRDMAIQLAEAGNSGKIACALLQCEPHGRVKRPNAERLLRVTRRVKLPLLFERDIAAAVELGAGGVHIPADEDLYHEARALLGGNAIIGAACELSRHDALIMGELGADYVAFDGSLNDEPESIEMGLEELIRWWSETVTVPCVAWDSTSGREVQRLVDAGADFVALGNSVWRHPEGAAAAVRLLRDQLADQQAST